MTPEEIVDVLRGALPELDWRPGTRDDSAQPAAHASMRWLDAEIEARPRSSSEWSITIVLPHEKPIARTGSTARAALEDIAILYRTDIVRATRICASVERILRDERESAEIRTEALALSEKTRAAVERVAPVPGWYGVPGGVPTTLTTIGSTTLTVSEPKPGTWSAAAWTDDVRSSLCSGPREALTELVRALGETNDERAETHRRLAEAIEKANGKAMLADPKAEP